MATTYCEMPQLVLHLPPTEAHQVGNSKHGKGFKRPSSKKNHHYQAQHIVALQEVLEKLINK